MTIAVTYENGKIFQHFGHTEQFKIYEVQNGEILSQRIVEPNDGGHGALAGFLKEQGTNVLICGGIGSGAKTALEEARIALYCGVCGSADAAVQAFLSGLLIYNPDIQCEHPHEEEGTHCANGDHLCGEDKHGCSGN